MADTEWLIPRAPRFGNIEAEKARDEDAAGIGVSDIAKEAYAGLKEGAGQIASAAGRAGLSDMGEITGEELRRSAEKTRSTESARARRYRESSFIDDGKNPALSDPDTSFGGAIAIKGAGMLGAMAPVVAGSVAGGVVAGPPGAIAAGAAIGGAQQTGTHVQRLRGEIDRASPEMLAQSNAYRSASEAAAGNGASEADADRAGREAMFQEADANGWRSLAQFGIGAAGGVAGATPRVVAGALGRGGSRVLGGVLGGAEKGVVKRAGIGAAEEAAVNAAQGAGSEAISQDAELASGLRDRKDMRAITNAGIEGGVMGAALGAPAGVLHGRGATRRPDRGVEASPDGVGSAEAQALGGDAPSDTGPRLLPPPSERRPSADGTINLGGSEDLAAYRAAVTRAKTPEARAKAVRALREATARARQAEEAARVDTPPNDAPVEREPRRGVAPSDVADEDGVSKLRGLLGLDPSDAGLPATTTGRDIAVPGREVATQEADGVSRLRGLLGLEPVDAEWSDARSLPAPERTTLPANLDEGQWTDARNLADGRGETAALEGPERTTLPANLDEGEWSDARNLPGSRRALPAPDRALTGPEPEPAALTETRRLPAPDRDPVISEPARAADEAPVIEPAAIAEPEAPAADPAPAPAARGRAKVRADEAVQVREDGTRVLRNPAEMAAERESLRRSAGGLAERTMGAVETNAAKLESEAGDAPFLRRAAKAAADPDTAQPWHLAAHEAAQEKASYGLKGRPTKELQGRFRELNATIKKAREDEIAFARDAERRNSDLDASDRAAIEAAGIKIPENASREVLRRKAEFAEQNAAVKRVLDANPIPDKVLDGLARAKAADIATASEAIRATVKAARDAGLPISEVPDGRRGAHAQWLAHLAGLEKEMKGGRMSVAQARRFAGEERLGRAGRYAEIATQNDLDRTIPGRTVSQERPDGVDRIERAQDRRVAEEARAGEAGSPIDDEGSTAQTIAEAKARDEADRAAAAQRREAARREGSAPAPSAARPAPKVETVRRRTPAAEAAIAKSRARSPRPQGELNLSRNLEGARREARRSTVDPTPAQAEAGNYRKPRFEVPVEGRRPLSVRVETAKGRERRGIDEDGKPWAHALPHDYGYLEGTKDNTGEPVDVHLGPNLKSDRVFVVDQQRLQDGKPSGYDEPKVMMGFDTRRQAEAAYVQGFGDGKGRARMGAVREFTKAEFEDWARSDAPAEDRGAAPKGEARERRSPVTYDAIGSDAVRSAAGFVEALHDRFGVDARVHVVEMAASDKVNGFLRRRRDGTYEMGINPNRPTASIAETVTHEYGHLLERELLDYATGEEQNAVREAYAAWRMKVDPNFRASDVLDHQTPMHIARYLDEGVPLDGTVTDAYRDYYRSFPEWFAREVALHLVGKPETQGLAGRFFARVAETWRSLIGLLKGHPVASREVAEFLDRYARPDRKPLTIDEWQAQTRDRQSQDDLALRRGVARLEEVLAPDGIAYQIAIPEGLSEGARDRLDANRIGLRRFGVKALTTAGLDQFNRGLFARAGRDLLSEVVEVGQRMAGVRQAFADPLMRHAQGLAEFERQNPSVAREGFRLLNRASALELNLLPGKNRSLADIRAANRHHGEGNIETLKSRSEMVAIQRAFEALPEDFRKAALDLSDTLRQQHNDRSRELMANLLEASDLDDAAKATLVRRAMNGVLKAEDEATLDNPILWTGLKDLSAKRAGDGLYVPFVRNGDFVVQTREHLDLKGGRAIGEDGVAFDGRSQAEARAKAEAFVRASDLDSTSIQHQVFDRATGERLVGTDIGEHEGETNHTYVVRVQRKGLHAFDSRAEAVAFIRKAKEAGTFAEISHEPLDKLSRLKSSEFTAAHVRSLMASIDKIPAERMPAAQREVIRGIVADAVARAANGNRFEKHSLARQNVLGMSDDLPRSLVRYAEAAAANYAALKSMPKVRGLFGEMRDVIKDAGIGDPLASRRSQVLDAIERQFEAGNVNPNDAPAFIKRALQWSYISHLASPMSSVMNATQVAMNTLPVLSGRFGGFRAAGAIGAAYRAIGATDAIWSGVKNTGKGFSGFNRIALDINDPVAGVRKRLAGEADGAALLAMLDHLGERGAFGNGTEFEFAPTLARGDKGLRRFEFNLDRAFRQLPTAVEAVNRSVTAVAAYRLAREAGMTDKAAVAYTFDTVMTTQGDYSSFNTPAWMKNPILAPAVQFKRFAQIQYQMLAGMVRDIATGTKEEKIQAARALTSLVAMQIVVAGTLSLPGTELIKMGATLSSLLLGTGGYDDTERYLKRIQEEAFGKEWGTALSRGLVTRALGFDVSSRASWADLLTGMQPDDLTTQQGQYEYVGRLLGGAPVGTGFDLAEGVRKIADGDPLAGFSKLIPVKVVGDTLKGVTRYQQGKATLGEAAKNAFGVRSARQAEVGEDIGAKRAARQDLQKEKLRLDRAIVLARTPRERAIAVSQARTWNKANGASGVHVNVRAAQGRAAAAEKERIALQGE